MKKVFLMKRNRQYVFASLVFCLSVVLSFGVSAQLQVDMKQGKIEPLPVAVVDFFGTNADAERVGRDVARVIAADLERSGLFRLIDPKAFIQDREALRLRPQFSAWRQINAQALVVGTAEILPSGQLRVEFRLWDVFAGTQLVGLRSDTQPSNWRRIGHIIADAIYKRITGEKGYFDTRVVYVAESGPAKKRIKRLAIMDQDGANHRYLSKGDALVLTPRFSPTAQEITYLAYNDGQPRVYIYNIDTGQREMLGNFPGMTFAPRFSPDGNSVIMSIAEDGNSDIYTMDLRTRRVTRLTRHPSIDTSPSFSPNGKRIVFNSDRGGRQQIYVMSVDDGRPRRITFGKGRYATPVWSPRGDLIAFTKMSDGKFGIGVMRPDGKGERILAEGFLVESPTWSPNGRVLMFFRQERAGKTGSQPRLFSIDLTGYNEREIVTPTPASDPAWSPPKP
jgi:TolB protein